MARPGDWSPLGLHGDPTPGDLDVLTSLHQEMEDLGELAGEVNSGLDRVLNTSTDGFIGKTAEAVRKKVDGHLKKFIASVGHSFSVSGPATLDYLNGIRDAQAKADQALAAAQGLSEDDPKLVALKAQVHDAQDEYGTVCRTYGDKLFHAGKIEQPISGWQLFLQALGILAIILAILGAIFGGWVGLIALAVNVALLIKTAVEFAEGKAGVLDLVLAVIGVLFPSTKGLNIGQLGKGLFNALKNLPSKIAGGIGNFGKGVTHFFTEGLTFKSVYNGLLNLPGLVFRGSLFIAKGIANLPSLAWSGIKAIGAMAVKGAQFAWGGMKLLGSTFKNDFHLATIGTTSSLGKIGVYAMSFGSRFVVSATLPLDFFELGIGARAAVKMGLGTRLSTPWSHLSQPIVGGGLHVGALAGSHTTFHAANGTTGFGGFDHAAFQGFNANGLTGLHSAGTQGLGALHGLNTGVNVGGLHNLSALDSTVHLGAGVSPSSVSHAMANVGGGASAFDHLTTFDHATGFERSSSGLLGPLNAGFSTGHVGMSHIGSMTTGSATSHVGAASVHGLRTDLTGSATGLHTAISDSMSGIRGAAGHVADFHAIGISELKSIVDGDISALKMTPDGVSMHIGAESGTPTALHMNLRTMSLTDGAGHQITVAPEAHAALGTTPPDTAPGAVHSAPPTSTSIKDGASTTFTDVRAPGTTHNGSASVSAIDVKAPGTTHNAPPSSADIKTGGATRNLDELSGGAKSFDDAGKFSEGPGSHAVTAQKDQLGVSAHDLDLLGRRDGTGDTAGAAAPAVHETEALTGAVQVAPTHIAVRPEPRPHAGGGPGDAVRPPRSRFEAITGGVGGRIGAERMRAWNNYEKAVGDAVRAEGDLHGLGGALDKPSETIDQAAAKLDAHQVGLGVDAARQDLARLDMDVDAIRARLDQLGGAPKGGHPGAGAGNAGAHDAGSVDVHGPEGESSLSKLERLSAPSHTPERSPVGSAPKAPTDAPTSGLSRTAGGYVDRLDGIAKDAGMSPADRSLYKQAIDDAVQADDFRGVAHNYAQFRDHVEITTLNHRFDAFRTHIDQGFDRLGDLGVNRAEWQAKVDAVHDARATHEMDPQNAALRDYTAFVERHVPSEVLTGKDVPRAFDASLSRVLGDLSNAGGPGEYVRLREELSGLLELDGFQARLNALRGELGDEAAALNARIGSATTFDEGASALQALHDFRAEQDLAARLDALKSDFSGAAHASVPPKAPMGFEERLNALHGDITDPHEVELHRLVDEAGNSEDAGHALQNLHDYRETRDFQARLDALRHDDAGTGHIDESAAGTHVSEQELADRFAALGHGDHPRIIELRQEAHAAGSAEESEKILDKLHAFQDKQEVKRQAHMVELREKIDSLTADRNAHLLNDRFDQADQVGRELDRLKLELDHTLTAGEKRSELFSELAKNVDRPEAAGHLDRIVDKGLSVSAAEHAAGAGGDAERSFADIEKLFNSLPDPGARPSPHVHSGDGPDLGGARPGHGDEGADHLKLPDTPPTPPSSSETHMAGTHTGGLHTGDLHGGDLHGGDIESGAGKGGQAAGDTPPPRATESGTHELTLEAPKERPESGATTAPDLGAHSVPSAPDANELRVLRGDHEPLPGNAADSALRDLPSEKVPSGTGATVHEHQVPSGRTGTGIHEHEVPAGSGVGVHEHQVAPTRVDLDPRWNEVRGTATPKTVDRSWVDPVSTPMGQGVHAPRYQVTAGFDVRQFTLGEKNVTDVTVRVDLAGAAGVAAHEIEAVWQRAQLGIERTFNAPGHQLPNGDLLHVTLERADGATGGAHLKVEVGVPTSTIDQHHWSVEATEQDLAHEFGHQLGLRDEYPGEGATHRPAVDGSLMGNYHNPSLDGLAHGGIRDRYLHVLQDHIASVDEASSAHGAGVHTGSTPSFVAPHAPKGSGSKVAVKSGRGGPSTAGASLSENLKFDMEITRFGGSKDFQRALGNYQIKPLAQYDGLAKGVTGTGNGVRFVATVPATADTDLLKLAQKYGEGFADGSAQGEHFGLVIGINGRGDKAADIKQAVEDFAKEWDKNGTFPVAVTGFTWKQPDPHLVAQGTQKEIPYGAIRETIVRDDLTSQMIKKLWPGDGSSGDMYLHIGDADVHSLKVGDKPLFDTAADLLSDMKKAGKDLPEVLSGGYKLPGAESVKTIGKNGKPLKGPEVAEAKKTADAVAAAADLDLKVRAAMAKVDARTVYFPEPNTFVKINSDSGLENGISFGEIAGKDTFHYEAKEGQYLVDSVVKTRHAEWDVLGPKVAPKIVSFDPSLALVTDAGRIGANVKDDVASLLHGLTQSHASRKTWTDQMDHYLTQHHPDLAKPDVSKALADIAFHDIRTDGRPQTPITRQTHLDALGGKDKYDAFKSRYGTEAEETIKTTLVPMALSTRKALTEFLGLEKAIVSPKAPVAGALHGLRGDGAAGDLTRDVSHTAQTQLPAPHGADVHLSGNHELTLPPKERPGNAGTLDASLPVGPVPKPFDTDEFRATRAELGDTTAPGASLQDTAPHDLPSQSPAVHTAVHESPQWHAVRAQVAPVTRDRIWMDPVSHPMGSGAHAPRYAVASAFDVRQFEVDGRGVTDLTVKVDLVGAVGVAAHEMDELWDRALSGVDRVFNAPGHELPNGDVLHVTLERGDGVSEGVHVTVEVHGPDFATNQHQWSVGAMDQDLAHEIGHQLGLRDEYAVKGSTHRADVHGSLMGNYHEPAMEGMTQGGVRGRYLELLHDHIGDVHHAGSVAPGIHDASHVVHADLTPGEVGHIAPHAPAGSDAVGGPSTGTAVRGGPPRPAQVQVPGLLTADRSATRFGGSHDFQQAVVHYEISPLAQYGSIAKGAQEAGDGVRFVATVPATADVDLMKLVKKYEDGFGADNASALNERFGLVIGINGRPDKAAAITKAVQDFAREWDEAGTFPVAVTGFTWRQPDAGLVAQGSQKEIPYGAIRESIFRDPLTSRMIEKFRPREGSSGEIYLHVGDADVKSMVVGGKPLFDRAITKLEGFSKPPEVVSGGYTLPGAVHAAETGGAVKGGKGAKGARAVKAVKGAKVNAARAAEDAVRADAAKAAAELDLKVRAAMAEVDARAVYFPEPNTFVRVDGENGLEREIGFGAITDTGRFSYEALEGRRLVDSVVTTRKFTWESPASMAVFDPELALVTDDERIAAEVTGEGKTVLNGLTQSHATRKTWSDQMAHYITQHLSDEVQPSPDLLEKLSAVAFHDIHADGRPLVKSSPKTPAEALGGAAAWKEFAKENVAHLKLAKIAVKTRDALVDGLKKPETGAAVSPPAPSAVHGKASATRPAGHGTSHTVSPRAPQPHSTDATMVATSSRTTLDDFTITEVPRNPGERSLLERTVPERAPIRPPQEPLLPLPPARMTRTQQLSAADRILPSRNSPRTLAEQLAEGLRDVLSQSERDALKADWKEELATEIWPSLSVMTRGEVRKLTMSVGGWTGEVEVSAKVVYADTDTALDSLEFEDGMESFVRSGFQRDKLSGLTGGALVKGKAAGHTDLTGQASVNWTKSDSSRVASSGRMFTRTKTAEPALTVGATIQLEFDFSAVRGRFSRSHFSLTKADAPAKTRMEVPLEVRVATSRADAGEIPDLTGQQHYLPPLRVEQTLALHGSDTLRDVFLVDTQGERTVGRLDAALLGDPADAGSLAAFGRRTFGGDWDRIQHLVLDRIGSLDVLQFELKGMTAGDVLEIDLGEGFGTLLVTAEVSSMKQWRNTAKTEFNTGSDTTRVFTHGESSDVALRATFNAQSADLGAGPGTLTGTVHGQVDREGVSLHQESVRTGTAVKMKVPGVIFNGSATLSFEHRPDPLGANPKALAGPGTPAADRPAVTTAETTPAGETTALETPAPATTVPEIIVTTPEGTTTAAHPATTTAPVTTTATGAVRPAKGAKATIGFQVLVDAAEARPVAEAGSFLAAERAAGPKRMEATHVEAGDIAWQPDPKVWEGLPAHTVVFDVLTGEEPAAGRAAAPAISDLVDGLGRDYFGSDWAELRPAAQDMAGREQLSSTLPPMTRDTTARSVPLPMPLHSNAQLALSGKLESLEYVRTMDAAEVNLLSDVTNDASKRLNTALTHGEWTQGGVQPDLADDIAFGLHGGAAYGQRFRSGSGVGGGSNSVASAKYGEKMVQYIATVSVGADLGRPGDAAAKTGTTEVRFLVAFPKSHTQSYEVVPDAAGHQVFTRPASVPKAAVPVHAGAHTTGAADAGDAVRLPATTTGTATAPLRFQPPERVTGGRTLGTGDVVLSIDDEAAMVKELKTRLSGAFGDRWGQVEGDINLFFDGAVLQPKTAGLTAGEHWGSTFTAGAVTADIKITKAEAEMTEFLRTEDNFEFELGTESSAGLTASKDSSSRRTMWQRVVVKAPHTAVTLARMRHMDTLKGRSFDFRSGVVSKNKTVEPASLFKGRVRYTVEVKVRHAVPGFGSGKTFTVDSGGEFAFPSRDLPVDPKTGAAPRPGQSFRPPRRIEDSQALGASDIVLNVSPLPAARTERPATLAAGPVDGSAVKVPERTGTVPETAGTRPAAELPASATDIREAVFRQLDAQGPKVFGSVKGWRLARQKMMDRLPASEFQRRLKPMMAGQPWVVRVNGREVIISASVKEMTHSANTKATEFNTAAVGVVGGARTEEHMGEPQVVTTGTNVTVVGTSDPIGAAPVEVFGGGTLAHTTQVEKIVETGTATRTAVGTKSKVPGSVFDGVARLHFEFRAPWRPLGRTVDKRVAARVAGDQRHIGELRDALATAVHTDPAGEKALGLREEFDQALKDQTLRIQQGIDGKRPVGGERTSVFASLTKRAFGVRRHTFGDAEIGFQAVVESADAVEVAEATAARFEAPRPGTVRPRPEKDAEAAPPVSMPKPPESIWSKGMSGGQMVRDLPDVRSLRTLLDTQGHKAYAGAWTHVTSNGTARGDLVMAAFPEDRIKAALPGMTRGEELTSEPFLLNGQKAWVSAKAEVVGLSHHRPEAKAEVALATENSTLFSRRGLHSRQVYLVGQLGALASAAESKVGAALTFGGGFRRRTRGDQASGGRTFNNAKIPTPLEHFDGGVKITFTFHHGSGIAGKGAGVVPFGLSVPTAEITEHVTEAAGHVFVPPKPKKEGAGDAETPKTPETDTLTADGTRNEVRELPVREHHLPPIDEEAAAVIPHEPVPVPVHEAALPPVVTHPVRPPGTLLRDVRRQPTILEEPEPVEEHVLIDEPLLTGELPQTAAMTHLDPHAPVQQGPHAPIEGTAHADVFVPNQEPAHTDLFVPNQEPAHTDLFVPNQEPAHTHLFVPNQEPAHADVMMPNPAPAHADVIVPNQEPTQADVQVPPGPAAGSSGDGGSTGGGFADVRQQHPEPIARNTRWTMWGHSGPTAETSAYAVEFGALDLRGVYVPPTRGEGIGAWHWHVGDEAEPVAVTPLTLRSPGAPGEAAPLAGTGRPFVASEAAREPVGAALQAAPWNEGLRWRTDSEDLYVFGPSGDEAREAVFADGLRPSGDDLVHPVAHVRDSGGLGSAWVTASRDIGWLRGRAAGQEGATDTAVLGRYGWRYDIAAPGGVDVNGTLDLAAPHPERREVLYPGGVDSRWIRGAQRLDGGRPVGPYMTNPGFVDAREPGTATEGTG